MLIIKLIFRGIGKQKLTTFINLMGLSIGLSLVMFIVVYLKNELQTDKFHQNAKNIYRVESEVQSKVYPLTAGPMAEWLTNGFPDIEQSARIFSPFFKTLSYVTVNNQSFEIKKPVFVDPSFFRIFSFPVLSGNIVNNFDNKHAVVLTETMSRKLFGEGDAVGKTLSYCGKKLLTVTAVLKELPANSSINFELLLPFASFNDYNSFDLTSWDRLTYQTIVVSKSDPKLLGNMINKKIKEQFPEKDFIYSLIPFSSIHFAQGSTYDIIFRHESKAGLYLFMIVAICILLIAVINFVNLTVATSSLRVKENGIRKIEGASWIQLSVQFIAEAVLISFLAAIIAALLIELLFPLFTNFLNNSPGHFQIRQPWFYYSLAGISLFTGIIAGIYPAFKFSRISTISILQSKSSSKAGISSKWNNGLLVFQFATSIALIASTLFLNKQMNYIQNRELGFDKEQIVYLRLTEDMIKQKDVIIKQLETIPGITYASTCDFMPGQPYSQRILTVNVNGEEKTHQVYHTKVSNEYLKTLGLEVFQGRDFTMDNQADHNKFIVNEAFLKEYGITEPLGMLLDGAQIIGVVKDFNFGSLYQPVGPLTIRLADGDQTTMMIRANSSTLKEISGLINSIKKQIAEIVPSSYIDVQFLNDQIKNQYIKEIKTTSLLGYFTFFAIFISCLGLFGLVISTTTRRIKEIGIRKVNGATISEVLIMLNKDFVKWVAIAFFIAVPIAYYVMNKWLENFAYKTTLSWWIFALAGLLALGIALLTVSWQSWKAATRNPVEALRYE